MKVCRDFRLATKPNGFINPSSLIDLAFHLELAQQSMQSRGNALGFGGGFISRE